MHFPKGNDNVTVNEPIYLSLRAWNDWNCEYEKEIVFGWFIYILKSSDYKIVADKLFCFTCITFLT